MEHRGQDGPHLCRRIDLIYKKDLQKSLFEIFTNETYTIKEIAKALGRPNAIKYFTKNFKAVPSAAGLYSREEIIKRLMGGRFY